MAQRPGVMDEVRIPAALKPGAYVLGFRWYVQHEYGSPSSKFLFLLLLLFFF
jgi:hypothetical protein